MDACFSGHQEYLAANIFGQDLTETTSFSECTQKSQGSHMIEYVTGLLVYLKVFCVVELPPNTLIPT